LVDLSNAQPQIISYQRQHMPLTQTRSGSAITTALEQTLEHSLRHAAEVAARMRVHAPEHHLGDISKTVVFLAAPWGMPNLTTGGPQYMPGIRQYIKESLEASFGDIPVSFYTSADAIVYNSRALGKHVDSLAVSLRGEMLELLLMGESGPKGYSTVPVGSRSIVRTLQSHGTLTEHEARSMVALTKHNNDLYYEPLIAAGRELSDRFADGVELLIPAGSATSVITIGEHPTGEWFAKAIAENPRVADLFTEESTVEALLPHHLHDHIAQSNIDDPFVLTEAVFVKGVY
jgi:hypothetical protein